MNMPYEAQSLPRRDLAVEKETGTRTDSTVALSIWPNGAEDPSAAQRMRLIEASGTVSFWDDPEEDVYDPEDGEPV
jgi:hypothetical protein